MGRAQVVKGYGPGEGKGTMDKASGNLNAINKAAYQNRVKQMDKPMNKGVINVSPGLHPPNSIPYTLIGHGGLYA